MLGRPDTQPENRRWWLQLLLCLSERLHPPRRPISIAPSINVVDDVVIVRLHGNEDDVARKFNTTENVRIIPPPDLDFKSLYARRNDAESINRAIVDSMWLSRAHNMGHSRQLLNLIGYALMVHSLALLEHRQRAAPLAA